jgi:hypothetical protein
MIKPTIGRVVWYWLAHGTPQSKPLAAIVCHVETDFLVNLAVFDVEGNQSGATGVPLIQDDQERPTTHYCEWMPYQKQVAAGTIPPVIHAPPK